MRIQAHNLFCLIRAVVAAAAVLVTLGCSVGVAQAASPAWKLIATTGPTNLPTFQTEVQRLTIEAEGGTYRLSQPGSPAEGQVTPITVEMKLSLKEGSAVATIESVIGAGHVAPGERIASSVFDETKIVSCQAADCRTPGTTIELSKAAEASEREATRVVYTNEATVQSGRFAVGQEVAYTVGEGSRFEYFAPGTTITGSEAGTISFSNSIFHYSREEGAIGLLSTTLPIPFDSPAAELQSALSEYLGSGSVTVTGGPGGSVLGSYYVTFVGPGAASLDVAEFETQTSDLQGQRTAVHVFTTVPGGPGTGEIVINPVNTGGKPAGGSKGAISLRIVLPAGLRATGPAEGAPGVGWKCSEGSGTNAIACATSAVVPALGTVSPVRVPVEVESPLTSSVSVPIEMSGGGAPATSYTLPIKISSTPAPAGTAALWAGGFDAAGTEVTQASGHPFSALTFFLLNTVRSKAGDIVPAGVVSDVKVDLPPGFSGNPLTTARCPQRQQVPGQSAQQGSPVCNPEMQIGELSPVVDSLSGGEPYPIYNDFPAKGVAAEFSSKIIFPIQSLLGSVRSDEDFGISIQAPNVSNAYKIYGSYAAIDGEPAAAHGNAFLTAPADCAEEAANPPTVRLRTESYELPGAIDQVTTPIPAVTGCDQLRFHPGLTFQPTTTQGSSPTGAVAHLHLPLEGLTDPAKLAEPPLKKAVVSLPEGITVNPSSADGLGTCTEAQMGYVGPGAAPNPTRFDEDPVTCPDSSKIGTVQIKTPLLEDEVEGIIYLAAQEENPFNSLLALYLVVEDERFGITLKLPGEVKPDPRTGQLTATFDNTPQLPFEDLTLNLRGGDRSTLATPEVCGTYKTTGSLEPWSAPESGPPAQIEEGGFKVDSGCASSASARPFGPSFEAGTIGTQAGAYSPLVVKVGRKDGEQELRNLDFTLPQGLLGRLVGIPYCSDSAIRSAESKSGKAERASSSCPAASRIGAVDTAAGVGPEPIHVSGNAYLAGPYKGAPLSAVVITPAVAGPFDLGDVVIRTPLFIDPESAQITARSDQIPAILKGIPLKLRSVAITLDRPGFTLDPTSCEPMTANASITGSSGWVAKPANRFQVTGCDKLKFRPRLKIGLKGSTTRSGHPALKAVLTYPKKGAYANIRRAQVNLPHSELLAQSNLNKTCTKPVLLEGKCPRSTVYGRARAWTPLLEKPLQGPVYLVGGYGYKLPALVADLNGQIRVVLKGKVDSGQNKGIRNTFEAVPDAPVSRFVLELKGGRRYGLLENSEDLCSRPQLANARFAAQNGLVSQIRTRIVNQCRKAKRPGKKAKRRGRKH